MTSKLERKNTRRYYRDYSNFKSDNFLYDLNILDWDDLLSSSKSLDEKAHDAINAINFVITKHAPMKIASRAKQKQLAKPWLTKGLIKSIKRKQKMYLFHLYKKYSNSLSHLIHKRKQSYQTEFTRYRDNLKTTWKLIGNLIKKKTKSVTPYHDYL